MLYAERYNIIHVVLLLQGTYIRFQGTQKTSRTTHILLLTTYICITHHIPLHTTYDTAYCSSHYIEQCNIRKLCSEFQQPSNYAAHIHSKLASADLLKSLYTCSNCVFFLNTFLKSSSFST